MNFSSSNLLLLTRLLIYLVSFALICEADPRISEAGLVCGTNRTTPAVIIPQFVKLMEVVSQRVPEHGWGSHGVNSTNISIFALANCYQDLPRTDCLLCYAASRTRLPRCLPGKSGRIYLDGCFLRYDIYDFFNETTDSKEDKVNCSSSIGLASGQELATLKVTAGNLITNLTGTAVANGGYAVAHLNGVYGLAQCWKTVSKKGCRECLDKASREIKGCFPSRDARALIAGCYLRYSTQDFLYDPSVGNSKGVSKGVIVAIVLGVTALIMLALFVAYAARKRSLTRERERINLGKISSSYNRSSLNYKYENLEKATNYFDPSTKVGQGGNGSVYKGTLPNGNVIAVKRLFFNTRQWVDEFFNEVNLINGIEHKNLVKLLGCSIEGPESLLVYEFVPNKSLDQYLFDKNKIKILSWEERFHIIVGTASGLAFLHGGSEIRIIHRDIKSSNVLLDENLEAKIADFGLARCFAADKTHLSTGIAGTLGYMAPEYLVKGQLTEKADVYSYGVLVLEIVCGRKNIAFADDSGSLLQTVWKLYTTNQVTEALDPLLKGDFPPEEASKVLKVGLLCTQASVALRPSMTEVVQMLTHEDYQIPEPRQPPFLNSSLLAGVSLKPSTRSLVTNSLFKLDEFYTTTTGTGSSSIQSSSDGPHRSDEFLLKQSENID
ncbi:cysteine-rich receptor-like protein kinase 42 [Nicotiana tomentosiformis]|uniref:cysteine-rich receptor-like protein kinase 42 n=1 Tax=Nicotiana tomentosiformis TaxID=4098 RepID=UPI00051AC8AC|nr:cysteine-rich receptor-like protein kinase 42 [Nicotiana tomentosiformis]